MGSAAIEYEGPAAVTFLIGLGALLTALLLWGLKLIVVDVFGAFLQKIADLFPSLPFGIGNPLSGIVHTVVAFMHRTLANAALAAEGAGVNWLLAAWRQTVHTAHAIEHVAQETLGALESLRHQIVPNLIHAYVDPLVAGIHDWGKIIGHVKGEIYKGIDETVKGLEDRIKGIDETARSDAAALDHRIDHTIDVTIPNLGAGIRHWVDENLNSLRKVIENHWRLALELSAAATVTGIIAREWPWLRCRNVGRVAKHLCGFPVHILEALLGGLLAALAIEELCRFGQLAELGAVKLLPIAEKWLLLENFVCLGGGGSYPSAYSEGAALHHATPPSVI